MNLTKILTYVFLAVAILLAYLLVDLIYSDIQEKKQIAEVEAQVIDKLQIIREAELAFKTVHGKYTANWDSLINFMKEGELHIINTREEIIDLGYQRDTVIYHYDTIDVVMVRDSLFSAAKYPNLDIDNIATIPGSGKKFDIFAGKTTKSGVTVDVVEVVDVDPIDKTRETDHEIKHRRPLHFGSRTEITTAGNWGGKDE